MEQENGTGKRNREKEQENGTVKLTGRRTRTGKLNAKKGTGKIIWNRRKEQEKEQEKGAGKGNRKKRTK